MNTLNIATCISLATLISPALAEFPAARNAEPSRLIAPPAEFMRPSPPREGAAYGWAAAGTFVPMGLSMLLAGSENDAFKLSGVLLTGAGLLAGPSMGQYYAGSGWPATIGLAARTTGLWMLLTGIDLGSRSTGCTDDCPWSDGTEFAIAGWSTMGIGLVYSLIDTHYAVKRARHRAEASERIGFAPTLAWNGDGKAQVGGRTWLRF